MISVQRRRICLLVLGALAAASCDWGPHSGEIVAELTTSEQSLGAVTFRVTAVEPQTIEGLRAVCTGCQVFPVRVSDREMRGIVTGDFSAGPLVGVTVSDRDRREAYSIFLRDLAAPDYSVRSVIGSSLRFPAR